MNYYRLLIPKFGELTADQISLICTKWLKIGREDAFGMKAYLISSKMRPIVFCSRKLSPTEQRYSTTEREMKALTYSFTQFKHQIESRPITFYTDHKPLVTADRLKDPFSRLGRLFFSLVAEDYKILHIDGAKNFLPDFLSRASTTEDAVCHANFVELKSSINWSVEQQKDETLESIFRLIKNKDSTDTSWLQISGGSMWLRHKHNLDVVDDILMHEKQIVCPKHLIKNVLFLHHDTPFAGHRAFEPTVDSIKARYYWQYLAADVKSYCQSCDKCQTFNYHQSKLRAPLNPIVTTRPFQTMGTDYMGPFKLTQKG